MNSRERVVASLNHKEPDRVPFDLGGTPMSGIHVEAYKSLREFLGLPEVEVKVSDQIQLLADIHDDLIERLNTDIVTVAARSSASHQLEFREEGSYKAYTDEWGIGWRSPKDGGLYFDMYQHPLAEYNTVDEIKQNYTWPNPSDPARFKGVRERALKRQEEGKGIVLGGLSAGVTEMHAWLRGFENYFMDFILNPDLTHYICETVTDMKIVYWENMLESVGDLVHVVVEADDMAAQDKLFFSKDTYREFIKPYHTRLFDFIKSKADVKVFFHSCGAIRPLIPDLIEAGIDILNPVQKSADSMNLFELKEEFGNEITFWGGGVDTQQVLPFGTPDEVRDDVKENIEALAPDGGFIFTTVHNTQADVPPENYMAMWEALQEYGVYK